MRDARRVVAGAMSGTSADGVDVALVRITGRGVGMEAQLLHHHHRPYDPGLRAAIFAARSDNPVSLAELADLGRRISLYYAATVNETLVQAGLSAADLAAVAAHGQTLFHDPPLTLQWLDPALIAAEVGCAVVSDFRRADCAVGGQGAPLVPFADYLLFRHPTRSRVLLNIGGIANLTYLPAGGEIDDVAAFDTGPGNCISDHFCRAMGPGYDDHGRWAARGRPIEAILEHARRADYFARPAPKSTDGPAMLRLFADAQAAADGEHRLEDLLATACRLTAWSIAHQLPPADEIYASGGGVYNDTLMRMLSDEGLAIRSAQELGLDPMAKEAVAFALLGAATLDGQPANVPTATGARRAVILGAITPKP